MLLNRNLLESVTFVSCSCTLLGIILNYVTNISPLPGFWFPLYCFVLFFVAITFSFKFIQWMLHLNKPLKYDAEGLVQKNPGLRFLVEFLPVVPKKVVRECKEYDTNELSVISTVLERRLVSSWYVPYVSKEIGFPFACKQLLDQMIGKTFQICNKIETKDVYIDICSVLITHLKEWKKAVKRNEKSPENLIESLYKTSHPISNTDLKITSAEHCTKLLRIILKELVPWELWDTPHSELLVRILSKRLDNFIDTTLADPIWLNDKLMTILKGKKPEKVLETTQPKVEEEIKQEPKDLTESKETEVTKTEPINSETPTIESALSTLVTKTTAPILQRPINEEVTDADEITEAGDEYTNGSEPVDIKSSPVLRQRRGRQGRNEVKIYDRIIEGSVKTWETDTDLQCISLGQDLLASLNSEITLSRLWGQESEGKETRFWFGEEDTLDMDLDSKEPSPVKKEQSPTSADALLKDLQSTVHQAKNKIGDLQVPCKVLDVANNDEAAGMMEGLLDFGIAGFKKGLRFTGLSDDSQSQEKSPSHKDKEKGPEKSPPPDSKEKKEPIISSTIQREDNGNSIPTLVKQQRVSSQDSVASLPKPIKSEYGALQPLPDSPEPEYEEAADLSTSIAKLRCLLQQRAEAAPNRVGGGSSGGEVWWEGAEETRGRVAVTSHGGRRVDSAALADEYDMSTERNPSPGQTSNNMQRLDKLFQRTVTGVFNSIKTAVGAEETAGTGPAQHWTYVTTSIELSVCGAVARLVGSRRAYNHVDAALDSLEQLTLPPPNKNVAPEDFEEWCAAAGAAWSAAAELGAAAGLPRTHLAYRLATILVADLAESFIEVYLDEVAAWLRAQVFVVFQQMADQPEVVREKQPTRDLVVDETCDAVLERVPGLQVFGLETAREAVHLTVSSLGHAAVNKDVIFRVLDLFTLHFKNAAGLRNPSFDAN